MNFYKNNWPKLPFRLGTTSYIIPDEILPNARFLADKMDDIELVLFEVDGDEPYSNIPDETLIKNLNQIAENHNLSYTVHLPLDLRLGDHSESEHPSILKAQKVIRHTQNLQPWSYIVHLDGKNYLQDPTPANYRKTIDNACKALEIIGSEVNQDYHLLAIENLEKYPADFIFPVFERLPVSQCVDIGHLWLDNIEITAYLQETLPRTRVVHLHGIGTRDHQSLNHTAPQKIQEVWELLCSGFQGVVTLEIFNREDLDSSLQVLSGVMKEKNGTV